MTGGGVWFESSGPYFWSYFHGDYTDEAFNRYIAAVEQAMLSPAFGGSMLTISHSPRMPSATQRQALGTLATQTAKHSMRRHAISSDSFVARGVVTAMNWASPKPFEERIFSCPRIALHWLSQHSAEVEDSLCARIRAVVPPAAKSSVWWMERRSHR